MPLIVEDGSARADATSFVSVAEANSYHATRANAAWTEADTDVKEAALVKAADYLRNERRFRYRGSRQTATQRLPWPRVGASERNGPEISAGTIPAALKDAQCELALLALTRDLQPVLARGGRVKTKTIGPLTTTYMDDAPAEDTILAAVGLLDALLRSGADDLDLGGMVFTGDTDGPRFDIGMHDFDETRGF